MDFGKKLQKLRKDNHLSQEGLAEKLNVSRQAVSKWESGSSYPEMEKLIEMSKIFDCTLDDLTNESKTTESIKNQKDKNPASDIVNDVTLFINKSIDMFTDMTGQEIFKLIFVIILVGLGISILKIPINYLYRLSVDLFNSFGDTVSNVLSPLLFLILNIIYIVGGFLAVYFIYKTQYLDKYQSKKIINKPKEDIGKESKSKEEKIEPVISPEKTNAGWSIIKVLGKIIMFFIKFIAICVSIPFIGIFITLAVLITIAIWLIIKGVIVFGLPIIIISLIILTGLVIELLFDLVFSKKVHKTKIFLLFIAGLLLLGIGSGIFAAEASKFTIINKAPTDFSVSVASEMIPMNNGLEYSDYKNVSYIVDESLTSQVKVEVLHYKEMSIPKIKYDDNKIFIMSADDEFSFQFIDVIVNNLKVKKIYDYNKLLEYEIKIYSSKENLQTIINNSNNYRYNDIKLITE